LKSQSCHWDRHYLHTKKNKKKKKKKKTKKKEKSGGEKSLQHSPKNSEVAAGKSTNIGKTWGNHCADAGRGENVLKEGGNRR